jgi:hypothetical protein
MKQLGSMIRRTMTGASMAGAAGAALALAACHPPHPHAALSMRSVSTLDCPDTQGDLTRKSAASDGKSCVYATESGDQVTLQLVSLTGGDVRAALQPIEAQLKTELPAADAGRAPAGSGGPDRDRVNIDLPGIHIHAQGDGHTDVDTAGVHVEAHDHDGGGDKAVVQVGGPGDRGVTVNAGEGGAQIHIDEGGSGVRARYILASETPGPHGYRAAGYEARGPSGGPIVVAAILAKSDDQDDLRHDVHALVRRNVGGW